MARFISLTLVVLALSGALAQDYATNYNTGDSGRSETVLPDGTVQGQYSYTDPNGKLLTVKYRAGKDGFQVEGDHLPRAPVPQAPAPQQQPQPQYNNNNNYNQQQYNQQPQQQYNQQPQQYNQQQQQPAQLPASTFFSNNNQQPQGFGGFNNNYQHPNAIPQSQNQYNPFQNQQQQPSSFFNNGPQQQYNGGNNNNGARGAKVSVTSQPGQGFSYTYES